MNQFDDIRPYHDSEVPAVIQRLLNDKELIETIIAFRFPKFPRWLRIFVRPVIAHALSKELSDVKTVLQVQQICSQYLDQVIEKTSPKLTFSGLENLQQNKPYLFISNHRDIVMDPAFVNYALYHNGFDTMRIAIGDNLLQKPFVSDLMRLNKSFIVKRSASGIREKMAAYMGLSSYIHHSIEDGCPIWIAQREGRAKDGIDQTDPAIIKMLYMSQKKGAQSFSEYINKLNIVPVVISYEYNPCDQLIAKELQQKFETGKYEKEPGEDMKSIVTGIVGFKGHVHISFGKPLEDSYQDAESVASAIDQQIKSDYVLHPSNYIAASLLSQSELQLSTEINQEKYDAFIQRLEKCEESTRPYFLALYANAILVGENGKKEKA